MGAMFILRPSPPPRPLVPAVSHLSSPLCVSVCATLPSQDFCRRLWIPVHKLMSPMSPEHTLVEPVPVSSTLKNVCVCVLKTWPLMSTCLKAKEQHVSLAPATECLSGVNWPKCVCLSCLLTTNMTDTHSYTNS